MFDSILSLSKEFPHSASWAIPIVGGLTCGAAAYLVGRRFIFSAQPAPVADALTTATNASFSGVTRDRRAAPRRRGNSVEVQLSLGEDQPPMRGWVLNRSAGGLCILSDHPVAENTPLRVRPGNSSESYPWTDATIRSCRQDGASYELGCQFHRMPSWNMLLQFG